MREACKLAAGGFAAYLRGHLGRRATDEAAAKAFGRHRHMFKDQRNRLLNALDEAHGKFYQVLCQQAKEADWPSLYFHSRSLEAARAPNFERFAEYAYAMLVSWGMQRPGGRSGPRMCEFGEYQSSLGDVWPIALQLREKTPSNLSESDWSSLKAVFCGIHCMVKPPKLVGNSKVMAHLLPNLIPPVDGEHTLHFLFPKEQAPRGIEVGWNKLAQMLKGFFYPVLQSSPFQSKREEWLAQNHRFIWDTSPLKIIDNLVWALTKMKIMDDGKEHRVCDPNCRVCKTFKRDFPQPHRNIVSVPACPGFVHVEEFPNGRNVTAGKIVLKRCDKCLECMW